MFLTEGKIWNVTSGCVMYVKQRNGIRSQEVNMEAIWMKRTEMEADLRRGEYR